MKAHLLRAAALAAFALSVGACASSKSDEDGRVDTTRREMTSAAAAPLRDVNIIRPDVPDVIQEIHYPYYTTMLGGGCPSILYEIGRLDQVLGRESYQPGEDPTLTDRAADEVSNVAVDAVEDAVNIIPFRSVVRRATGAQRAQRDAERAIRLGQMRRTFLRGYGAALGCRGVLPDPPPPPPIEDAESQAADQPVTPP